MIKFIGCNAFNIPKKYHAAIEEIQFEGREDGYWLYLNEGYKSENGYGCNTIHEYNRRDLMEQIRQITKV